MSIIKPQGARIDTWTMDSWRAEDVCPNRFSALIKKRGLAERDGLEQRSIADDGLTPYVTMATQVEFDTSQSWPPHVWAAHFRALEERALAGFSEYLDQHPSAVVVEWRARPVFVIHEGRSAFDEDVPFVAPRRGLLFRCRVAALDTAEIVDRKEEAA